ncbi:MAG TPA: tetratricopeptide repeat protein [bacterium]|jgi:tetratricopeptide (TPR) repeat protein
MPDDTGTAEIPAKAREYYNEAVSIIQEDVAMRRTMLATDSVIGNLRRAIDEYSHFFEAWRLLGEIYLSTEQVLQGYLALKRADLIKPGDMSVKTLLGEASLITNRPELALKYLSEIEDNENTPLASKKLKALALAKCEKWEDALRTFGEALAVDPQDGNLRLECSRILNDLGYHPEAASVLADFLDPYRDFIDNQASINGTGWIMPPHESLERLSKGASSKARKIEIVPQMENYMVWYALGNIFLDGEHFAAAVTCYRMALKIHPDYYDCLHNMGLALVELGRANEAIQLFETAIETSPDEPDAYLSLAELLEEEAPDDTDEISLNYLMYYRLDPDAEGFSELEPELVSRLKESPDISLLFLLAHVYLEMEEPEKAYEILNQLEKQGSDDPMLFMLLGRSQAELEMYEEAVKSYRTSLENTGEYDREGIFDDEEIEPKLRYELASVYEEIGKIDEAVGVLKEDVGVLDSDGLTLLAELVKESDPGEAGKYWELAIERDGENLDALMEYAVNKSKAGDTEGAIELLEKTYALVEEDEELTEMLGRLYAEIGADELSPQMGK